MVHFVFIKNISKILELFLKIDINKTDKLSLPKVTCITNSQKFRCIEVQLHQGRQGHDWKAKLSNQKLISIISLTHLKCLLLRFYLVVRQFFFSFVGAN